MLQAGETPNLEAALVKDLGNAFERQIPELVRLMAAGRRRAAGDRFQRCWPKPYCTRRPGPCAAAPVRAPASRNLCAVNGRRRGGGAAQQDGAE
jgi:hypothetical protein